MTVPIVSWSPQELQNAGQNSWRRQEQNLVFTNSSQCVQKSDGALAGCWSVPTQGGGGVLAKRLARDRDPAE